MAIRNRRPGREAALRVLYQIEIGDTPFLDALKSVGEHGELSKDVLFFAERIARGVEENLEFIDDKISRRLIDWTIDRLAPIDRNLMRMAVYELYYCQEIPPAVTLNEAVELAKKYSTPESSKFLNGVVGRILEDSPKWNWVRPAEVPAEEIEAEAEPEPIEVPEEQIVEEGSESEEEFAKVGRWMIRTAGPEEAR